MRPAPLYVYFVERDNGIRYARDATVRFDHLHPFILRRIAVLSARFEARPHFTFVSREIYSYPTLYPIHCGAGRIFIIFLSAKRDIEVSKVFLSSAINDNRLD